MPTYQFIIADLSNGTISDISDVCMSPVVSPRLGDLPQSSFRVPLTPEVLAISPGDGYPLLFPLNRRLIVIRDSVCVANDLIWRVKPIAGPSNAYVDVECNGPLVRLQSRYCQDVGGQIFDGVSADGTDRGLDLPAGIVDDPTMTVMPAQMLKEAVDNTIANDGDLGLDTGGTFSTTPVSSGNVAFAMRNLAPLTVGDLATLFTQTGVCDIYVTPTAAAGSSQGALSAVDQAGSDISGSVSFDYGTGAKNVAWAYPEASGDEFCNKLVYELEPRIDSNHFANNVTIDAPGVTTDPSGSRSTFGVYHDILFKKGLTGLVKNTSNLFKLYVRLYDAELAARMVPMQKIRISPQAGLAPSPWDDYNLGDIAGLNLAQLGFDVSAGDFRIIGWDAMPDDNGAERVELIIGWSPSS